MGNREFRSLRQRGMEHRALNTTGEADIIPTDFIAQLERAMLSTGSLLSVCDQVRTASGNPMTLPTVDDTDNDAADADEAESMEDASAEADPTFGKVTFGAFKASSKVVYSTELEQDAGFDLNGELSSLLGERIGRTLNARCTTGNGTTAAQGIVTGSVEGFESAEADAIDPDDILELIHSVDPSYRNQPGVGFMCHDKILLAMRKLKETETGRYLWQPSCRSACRPPCTATRVRQSGDGRRWRSAKIMLFGLMQVPHPAGPGRAAGRRPRTAGRDRRNRHVRSPALRRPRHAACGDQTPEARIRKLIGSVNHGRRAGFSRALPDAFFRVERG